MHLKMHTHAPAHAQPMHALINSCIVSLFTWLTSFNLLFMSVFYVLLCFEMLSTNKDLIIFYVLFVPCELGSLLVLLLYRWLLPSM